MKKGYEQTDKQTDNAILRVAFATENLDLPFYAIYGHFKTKICNTSEKKCYQKNFTVQKSLRKNLYSILGGQNNI